MVEDPTMIEMQNRNKSAVPILECVAKSNVE
jgi:hypothetical protein